jgi:hypothetical protein
LQKQARKAQKGFLTGELQTHLDRKAALDKERPMPVFLAGLTAKPYKRKELDRRTISRKRRDRRANPPLLNKKETKLLNSIFLAAICGDEAKASNLATKSPYDREGRLALDEIPDHKLEAVPTELINENDEADAYLLVDVGNPPSALKKRIQQLIHEYKEIFKTTVQKEPSSAFQPFCLEVDDTSWEVPANSTPPRSIGQGREKELTRMIDVLLKRGLIEDCSDAYYSHAFLTPKSNGSWRMVLDF